MKSAALPAASRHRWARRLLMALAVAAAMHPISTDEFWWQLSRGRAVLNGEVAPSRSLMAGDVLNDADWLGGAPFYCLYCVGGFSALMLLKIAVVAGLAIWMWRRTASQSLAMRLIVCGSLILVAAHAAEPTPILWNMLGLLFATTLLERIRRQDSRASDIGFVGLAIAWANLAPGCLLIVLPSLKEVFRRDSEGLSRFTSRHIAYLTIVTGAGLCLTPRGLFTIWDSARQIMPLLVESPSIINHSPWRPIWLWPIDAALFGWLMLCLTAVVQLSRQRPALFGEWLLLAIAISLGSWSQPNALVISVWLARWIVSLRRQEVPNVSIPIRVPSALGRRVQWCANAAVVVSVCLLSIALSLGIAPLIDSRLGWGLDRRLEIRMLDDVFNLASHRGNPSRPETAHCTDIRSAGMVAWSGPGHCKPYLVSQRALLNGRLREEVLLNHEIETGWLKQHRRTDGTDGGWWLPIRARNTSLLFTSAEQTRLIESLRPTIWKPLSLDSPVIAYALAGDPRFNLRVAEVRSQQELVDRGAWVFQPETSAGNDQLVDWIGWCTGMPNPYAIMRQSAVLRAMNLPMASARVLRPLLPLRMFDWKIRDEVIATQLALADREILTIGEVGEFRRAVLISLGAKSGDVVTDRDPNWQSVVALYLAGETRSAAEQLRPETPAVMSAMAMLEWEAGRLDQARIIWQALQSKFAGNRYALLSRYALESGDY